MSVGACEVENGGRLRAVVVDDERMAREYLKLILSRVGGVEVVTECTDACECLRAISEHSPDVVFLDIHLPDSNGMDVANAVAGMQEPPLIVFVTGYDEFAVPAFEVAAVDYIMKPFSQERVEKALGRIRARLASKPRDDNEDSLLSLGKLAIKDREGCKLVDAGEICFVRTHNRKTSVHTPTEVYVSHSTLGDIEQKLRGQRFFRANEGCLVNLDRVKEIVYYGPRTYELLLSEPEDTFIPLSRSRAQKLREALGF